MRTPTTEFDNRYSATRSTRKRLREERTILELAQFLVELVDMPEVRPILEETGLRIVGYDNDIQLHLPQKKAMTANESFWLQEIRGIHKILKRLHLEIHITDTPSWTQDDRDYRCTCYDCEREREENDVSEV